MAKDTSPTLGFDKEPQKLKIARCPTCGGILGGWKHNHAPGEMAADAALKPTPYVYGEAMKIAR